MPVRLKGRAKLKATQWDQDPRNGSLSDLRGPKADVKVTVCDPEFGAGRSELMWVTNCGTRNDTERGQGALEKVLSE